MMTRIIGATLIARSRTTGPIDVGRMSIGTGGPSEGLIQQRAKRRLVKILESKIPGSTTAANSCTPT